MKPLITLQDADIFPEAKRFDKFPEDRPPRQAVKVVIFDDKNKIALVGKNTDSYLVEEQKMENR
ncbi:MAG: hypothetical protein A3B11_00705 [Candidatus Taylorbacteria bacterium RIFCSPLOWO2_01_FULL_44_26]|uniref:Uncharacterized protein n=2 Tax=Candidatus Tayloriibacteriota TaxID=1817919 RepID=A0A1G2MLF1_9BACT|nr:MAG: hypothetical protein A3D50_00620 [Candidatus Taylorbacteria bacterium RIFCSPHIGHO2_02_FULL_44_12]OHA31203.1 MAG: hypothetical protein A3B11_00705 [Candidatus Taylorbacteria bacterium RIFCSPLOWO2_01_FULL_44_26]